MASQVFEMGLRMARNGQKKMDLASQMKHSLQLFKQPEDLLVYACIFWRKRDLILFCLLTLVVIQLKRDMDGTDNYQVNNNTNF